MKGDCLPRGVIGPWLFAGGWLARWGAALRKGGMADGQHVERAVKEACGGTAVTDLRLN